MDDTEQNRSEAPSAFKLMRARRKGTVARGMDLGFLAGLVALLGYAWMSGPAPGTTLGEGMRRAFVGSFRLAEGNGAILAATGLLASAIWRPLALFLGIVFIVVLLMELLQTGIVFSTEPLKFDLSRLNPARGIKRLFTVRLLIETLKGLLKLGGYTTAGWLVIRGVLQSDIGRVSDGAALARVMARAAFRLLASFALVALLFAVLDQLISRRDFLKRMRMSRREMRQEQRDREGEPRLKQRRKQMHAEFSQMSQSLRNLKTADVLIINPSHVAVALRYDGRAMSAPVVVSKGSNLFAQRLKRLAFIYGVPVVENRALARALLRQGAMNRAIPGAFFQPVADIYNRLRRQRER